MKKITIGSKRYSLVRSWEEDTWFNGSNHISRATNSQWEHEELHRSATGLWILQSWSQWQGSRTHWTEISAAGAGLWLATHGHALPDGVSPPAEL